MRHTRASARQPIGATIEDRDRYTWTKITSQCWSDGDRTAFNREMDHKLDNGAELVVIELDVNTTVVPVEDLERNDYVLLSWGFWDDGDHPFLEAGKSQMLWHVAGWISNESGAWIIAVDAPEHLLDMANGSQLERLEDIEREPIEIEVEPGDTFHVVDEGQRHSTWEYDWDGAEGYEFVEPPEPAGV